MNASPEYINQLYRERKKTNSPFLNTCREMAELANGDVHVVHPEMDINEKPTAVNLFPGGLDALATRAGSLPPDQKWPSLREGFKGADAMARARREWGLAWWDMQNMQLVDRQRFRHFFGFGCMPVTVLPTAASPLDKRDIPHWRARSPLNTYPAPTEDRLDMEPVDSIFACQRPRAWLTALYPAQMAILNGGPSWAQKPDDLFEVLEYIDCDEIVLVCAGRATSERQENTGNACVVLERVPNKAGIPLVVVPGRITLDRLQGALYQMLPAYHKAAKLDSMNLLAIAESIYPEKWVVGHPGDPQAPEIVVDANAAMGIIGEIAHGNIMTLGNPTGGAQAADMAIDRLERQQRIVASLPAQTSGEGATNVRTARQGNDLMGSAIDMPLQEAQEIMEASKEAELRRAVAVAKGWFGSKSVSFYISRKNESVGPERHTPNDVFETDEVHVEYGIPGTDSSSLPIILGQKVNTGTMSLETARELDPMIEDPTLERDRVEVEGLIRALLASIEQGVQQGAIGPDEVAQIAKEKYATHDQLFDVVMRVHDAMQKKQAEQAQAQAGSPETQPGIGPGGAPPGQPPNPFQGPPSSPALAQILGNLRAPANQSPSEQTPPQQSAMAQ